MSSEQEMVDNFNKLWNYSKPEETEKKFREILQEVKSSGNRSAYLQLQTQLARTQGLQMKFDEAHKILDEVEKELDKENIQLVRIRYLLERGRTFNSSKQKEKALELFHKAYELGLETGEDFFAIDAIHMIGIADNLDDGIKWNEIGIRLAENSKDERSKGWLGALYNNTGWNYHDKKEYLKALELFEKNVVWHTERKSGYPEIIAKWCVARTYRSLDRIDEAIEIHNALLEEIKDRNLEQDGYIFEELGELHLIKKNPEDSKKNFRLAYEMLSKDIWLAENEKERLERMKKFSDISE